MGTASTKKCKSCGKVMISKTDLCLSCRENESQKIGREGGKTEEKYIRKNATFNRKSKHHMAIWEWCLQETEDFKSQNFADFVREKLEWCMEHEGDVR